MKAHILPIRVYYEDTDAGGVVYYANYLRFMERARTEWLRSYGFEQDRLITDLGIVFAVRSANIDYLRPARFNDMLEVKTRVIDRGRASLAFHHSIEGAQPVGGTVYCRADVKVACVALDGMRPRALPPTIITEIFGDD